MLPYVLLVALSFARLGKGTGGDSGVGERRTAERTAYSGEVRVVGVEADRLDREAASEAETEAASVCAGSGMGSV